MRLAQGAGLDDGGSRVRAPQRLAALLVVVVPPPLATAQGTTPLTHALCVPVHATGVGQDLGDGRTQATISSHRFVVGHTAAAFTINQVVGTTASFTGPIVFTNRLGTLTAQVAGTFDVVSGRPPPALRAPGCCAGSMDG
jgi:hypothetical protein